jgi:uncharacterized protein YegL
MATQIDIVIDRSGSMATIFDATVQGLNEFLTRQCELPNADDIRVSVFTFDHDVEYPIQTMPVKLVVIDPTIISPRGTTALYDAIGFALEQALTFDPRIVVIITDGYENASRRFKCHEIMEQINERRRHGWTFMFLGANQDAIATGAKMGIPEDHSCTFDADHLHVTGVFRSATSAVQRACSNQKSGFTPIERAESSSHRTDIDPSVELSCPSPLRYR